MSSTYSKKGIAVWIICVLFYFYEFLLRTVLGTFQNPIMEALNLTPVRFALLSSTAYLFIYGAMQIPVGIVVERFGLKKSMFIASLICVGATLGFANANSYSMAIFYRILMGLGSSFGFICLLFAVYDWMPRRNIALFIGLSQLLGTMGPVMAGGPIATLAANSVMSWRSIFAILGFLGLLISFLILLVVDKNRESKKNFLILSRPRDTFRNLGQLIRQPQIWFIALFNAFIYFSLEYLSENECKNFLSAKGFSGNFSSYMITIAWIGFAVSSPIVGSISDKLMRRKQVMYFSAITTFCCLFAIVCFPATEILLAIEFLGMGVGIGAANVGIVTLSEHLRSSDLALGLGLNNGITILFVSMLAPVLGIVFAALETGTNSLHAYQSTFSILVILPLMAFVLALCGIKETYAKSTKENIILTIRREPDLENI
ncbi:MAG: MFS transporter [Tatlockia sp.]|nr:MFS transporter [Tatlockia sp.]